jgi:hypothetical protein
MNAPQLSFAPLGLRIWLDAQRAHDPDARLICAMLCGSRAQTVAGVRRVIEQRDPARVCSASLDRLLKRWQQELTPTVMERQSPVIIDFATWRAAREPA